VHKKGKKSLNTFLIQIGRLQDHRKGEKLNAETNSRRKKTPISVSIALLLLAFLLPAFLVGPLSVAAQEELPREQVFYFPISNSPTVETLNPFDTTSAYLTLGYETLGFYDQFSDEIKPRLAESWEWLDDFTFEVRIHPVAHWESGTPVTAGDVEFVWETMADRTYGGMLADEWEACVESLEVVDTKTIRIHLKEDTPRSKYLTGFLTVPIAPKHRWSTIVEEQGVDLLEYKNWNPEEWDTSGPYTLLHAAAERYTFERVQNYWGREIGWHYSPKYVMIGQVGDEAIAYRVMKDYEGDYSEALGRTAAAIEWLQSQPDVLGAWDIEAASSGMMMPFHVHLIFPNFGNTLLRNQWLREACAYAIDYQKSIDVSFVGMATRVNPSLIPTTIPALVDKYMNKDVMFDSFDCDVVGGVPLIKYDPDKAIEILEEHCEGSVEEGWTYNGEPVGPWKIPVVSDWTSCVVMTQVVAAGLTAIGIPSEVVSESYTLWANDITAANYDWTWYCTGVDAAPDMLLGRYTDFFVTPFGGPWIGSQAQYPKYFTEDYPDLPDTAGQVADLVKSLASADEEESIPIIKDIQEIITPQLVYIPLMSNLQTTYWCSKNWVNFATRDDPFEHYLSTDTESMIVALKHVYPRPVTVTDFSILPAMVEAGSPITASVTLRNTGDYEHEYLVEVSLGPPKSGPGPDVVAWKIVTVPAKSSLTETLDITLEEQGSYVLTVDEWRIGKFDPGDPVEKVAIVTPGAAPGEYTIEDAVIAAEEAKAVAQDAKTAAQGAQSAAEAAQDAAEAAQTAAQGAADMMSVWGANILTIVVVLVGVYVLTRRR